MKHKFVKKLLQICITFLIVVFSNKVIANELAPLEFGYQQFEMEEEFLWEDVNKIGFVKGKITKIWPCAASSNIGSICVYLRVSPHLTDTIAVFDKKFKKKDIKSLQGYNFLYGQVEKRELTQSNAVKPIFVIKYVKYPHIKAIKNFTYEYLRLLEILSDESVVCIADYRALRYRYGFIDIRTGHIKKSMDLGALDMNRAIHQMFDKTTFPIENESILYGLEYEIKGFNSMMESEKNVIRALLGLIKNAEDKVLNNIQC